MNKKTSLQKLSKSSLNTQNTHLQDFAYAGAIGAIKTKAIAKTRAKAKNNNNLNKIANKPKILTLLFYSLFATFGIFALCISEVRANHTKPEPATFPQYECVEPKKFSKIQRDNIIYAYNFGAPHGMGYTLAAIAWQESCAGVYMMNFSDPSAGLYHAHIPVVLKYYSKYEDNAFTRNVMGQMLIDNRLFASQIALDTLLYWQKYHKGNHKNTIKSYNKGFKWQKDKENNALAESYYNSVSKKMRALEGYIPRYSRVKNQSLFVELEDKNKQLEQTFKTLQNAKKIEKKQNLQSKDTPKTLPNTQNTPNISQNNVQNQHIDSKHKAQSTQDATKNTPQSSPTKSTKPPKQPSNNATPPPPQEQKKIPPIKPFIEPKKDTPKPKFDSDDFIELPISPIKFEADLSDMQPQTRLANNQNTSPSSPKSSQNLAQNPQTKHAQKLQKLDELFDDFNLIFEGK